MRYKKWKRKRSGSGEIDLSDTYMNKWLLVFGVFLMAVSAMAQSRDTLPLSKLKLGVDSLEAVDTSIVMVDVGIEESDYPNPKKAAYWSLAIPGAGQIYNRRWWKVPLVYGALGGMVYLIDFNTRQYKRLKTALDLKREDMPHEFSGTNIDTETALLSLRDGFDKDRQLSYIFTVVVYGLQAMEAFVDAHLKNFDVDDDLSFKLKPSFEIDPTVGQPALGIGVSIPLSPVHSTTVVPHPAFGDTSQ